jgi:hypothetical protein
VSEKNPQGDQSVVFSRGLTIPILSAYFLLIGRVFGLTSVPSGYRMNVRGMSCSCARLPSQARRFARYRLSDAHERAKKIKL